MKTIRVDLYAMKLLRVYGRREIIPPNILKVVYEDEKMRIQGNVDLERDEIGYSFIEINLRIESGIRQDLVQLDPHPFTLPKIKTNGGYNTLVYAAQRHTSNEKVMATRLYYRSGYWVEYLHNKGEEIDREAKATRELDKTPIDDSQLFPNLLKSGFSEPSVGDKYR